MRQIATRQILAKCALPDGSGEAKPLSGATEG